MPGIAAFFIVLCVGIFPMAEVRDNAREKYERAHIRTTAVAVDHVSAPKLHGYYGKTYRLVQLRYKRWDGSMSHPVTVALVDPAGAGSNPKWFVDDKGRYSSPDILTGNGVDDLTIHFNEDFYFIVLLAVAAICGVLVRLVWGPTD